MKKIVVAVFAMSLLGCGSDSKKNDSFVPPDMMAVIATDDYSSSQVEFYEVDGDVFPPLKSAFSGASDMALSTYGEDFYVIRRYGSDNVIKSSLSSPYKQSWLYSTNDDDTQDSSNPYQLVFVDSSKAFVIRYGSDKLWLVDLNAATEQAFKIGEFDLSDYSPVEDGAPSMSGGVIVDGKLFITMQRLVSSVSEHGYLVFAPSVDFSAYVAVIDIDDLGDLKEVDTGKGSDGLKGIPLNCANPSGIHYHSDTKVLVNCIGDYENNLNVPGGVDAIDPVSYTVESLIVESSGETKVDKLAIIDGGLAFFTSFPAWGKNTLYAFDPSTGNLIDADPVAGLANKPLLGLGVDPMSNLWVLTGGPGVPSGAHVIDTASLEELSFVNTLLPPVAIGFVGIEK